MIEKLCMIVKLSDIKLGYVARNKREYLIYFQT